MTPLKAYIVSLLFFFSMPAFAQIQKGNYSFGGDMGVTGAFQKDDYLTFNGFKAALSPSISKFLTNKWVVGVRPILSTTSENNDYFPLVNTAFRYTYKNTITRLGLELSSRYYFNEGSDFKFFGFVKVAYDHASSYSYDKGYNIDGYDNANFLNYQGGIGANYFFQQDVALEATLSYGHVETPDAFNFLTVARVIPSQSVLLNVKMANFISLSSKTDKKETPQYIGEGRQTIGGNVWIGINKTTNKSAVTSLQFNPQFSQLITDKLMLMGDFNWTADLQKNGASSATATVGARYYMPIKKRLYVYPQASYSFRRGESYINGNYKHLMGLGFGGSYFLSENIALEATFLQGNLYLRNKGFSETKTVGSTIGLGNVGLTYFMR